MITWLVFVCVCASSPPAGATCSPPWRPPRCPSPQVRLVCGFLCTSSERRWCRRLPRPAQRRSAAAQTGERLMTKHGERSFEVTGVIWNPVKEKNTGSLCVSLVKSWMNWVKVDLCHFCLFILEAFQWCTIYYSPCWFKKKFARYILDLKVQNVIIGDLSKSYFKQIGQHH